ncbi:imelysin family protein [Aquabacterium sp. A7-Y]|uniref:imelysin family protein n=1 Tax=Aquabacterium sp. A7-Y TaxID=1349605 RepID=UPI00223D1E80|nr:imelysin family protein [Aquabacterium sp. A7-Y]MCW7539215.1 imelysin family protein [Aquabacterium sp. A7-Y]
MTVRLTFALSALAALCLPAAAGTPGTRPVVAVPYYTAAAFMQGVHEHWYAPRAAEFARQGARLEPALQAYCEPTGTAPAAALQQARGQWRETALAWDRLSGVSAGPLVARRSARQIDFVPTRPELIQRAIEKAPDGPAAMERIGTPAKGLPALEWLLWKARLAPATPACRYAVQVAADIAREAEALAQAFEAATREPLEAEPAPAAMAEVVNQWVGALERLRWQDMERPVRSAGQGGRQPPAFPRLLGAATQASWQARWEAVRRLGAALPGEPVPAPNRGLVPLETYLRGRGLNEVADRLAAAMAQADLAVRRAAPQSPPRVLEAAAALTALKRYAEDSAAPALEVSIGFSDADGD